MTNNYQKLFELVNPPVRNDLADRIMLAIDSKRKLRRAWQRFILATGALSASLAAIVGFVIWTINSGSSSGFGTYAQLLVSDFQSLTSMWQSYLLILMETLPILEIVSVLGAVAFTLLFLKRFLSGLQEILNIKNSFNKLYGSK